MSSAPNHSQQGKSEKKLMDEKIAKVREVVRNVSANDIVLALHNFDLDVEKTIHAFCEGGSQSALGDWEQPSNTKKRQQKKAAGTVKAATVAPTNGGASGKANGGATAAPTNGYKEQQKNGYSPASPAPKTVAAPPPSVPLQSSKE